jgi:hypothetical protein
MAMPRLLLLAALAALASTALAAEVFNANAASRDTAPVFREAVPFSAVITVKNTYDRAVRIGSIDTTCSCSKLELAGRFLLPGETTTLAVAADNIRRSGPQQTRVSLFLTDPDLDPIEVYCWWQVIPAITVDAIAPGQDPAERPADIAWRDIYRYVAHERPDEPQRFRKRIRLQSPPGELPEGGLRILGIDYAGTFWAFDHRTLDNGAVLLTASSRDQQGPLPVGSLKETVVVRTNHPDKPAITLHLEAYVDPDAGRPAVPGVGPADQR